MKKGRRRAVFSMCWQVNRSVAAPAAVMVRAKVEALVLFFGAIAMPIRRNAARGIWRKRVEVKKARLEKGSVWHVVPELV